MLKPELPRDLYDVAGTRAIDAAAIDAKGEGHGFTLMKRAGVAAFELAKTRWPNAGRLLIFCGPGNNGGDGYTMALEAAAKKRKVTLVEVAPPTTPDAIAAAQAARDAGIDFQDFAGLKPRGHLFVDALLGIGLSRPPEGDIAAAIEMINAANVPVLSLDVPSGVDVDTGDIPGIAVRADATISFITCKYGCMTGRGRGAAGDVYVDDIRVYDGAFDAAEPVAKRIEPALSLLAQMKRSPDAHKGDSGHVLVIGGDHGMGGAVRLAGEAALRSGAGVVSVATRPENVMPVVSARPELMVHGVENANDLTALIERADVIAIGPGLGSGAWGQVLFDAVLDSEKSVVVDADALNLLAKNPRQYARWVLTPHPGEAARLLGCESSDIQADRAQAVRELANRFSGIVVLKGAGTLVTRSGQPLSLCTEGNAGMATAGSGDVLTGVIASLIAQGMARRAAARAGVWLHARAGDLAAEDGMIGMVAGDLLDALRKVRNMAE